MRALSREAGMILSHQVYLRLKAYLRRHVKVPTEGALMAKYQVSRSTVECK